MHVEYGGFIGTACSNAANELQTYLQQFGVDVECVQVEGRRSKKSGLENLTTLSASDRVRFLEQGSKTRNVLV